MPESSSSSSDPADSPSQRELSFLDDLHESKLARIKAAREAIARQHRSLPSFEHGRRATPAPLISGSRRSRPSTSLSPHPRSVEASHSSSPNQSAGGENEPYEDDEDLVKILIASGSDIEKWSRRPTIEFKGFLRSFLQPVSNDLDPFDCLPIRLNPFKENLISFYLQVYHKTAYSFSNDLSPHPAAKSFATGLISPGTFHINLARAALHRLSLGLYSSDEEKRALEVAALRHKGHALSLIRDLSAGKTPTSTDDLLAATINIGLVNHRYGPQESSPIHFTAARRLVKERGGPSQIQSRELEHLSLCFECGVSISQSSFVWDASDFPVKFAQTNDFFALIARVWLLLRRNPPRGGVSKDLTPQKLPYLRPRTPLYPWLKHDVAGKQAGVYQDVSEMTHQLTCLFLLSAIFVEHHSEPDRVFEYKLEIERKIRDARLAMTVGTGCVNITYIMTDSDCCLKSDRHRQLLWSVAGFMYVIKNLPILKQVELKNWLLKFLEGESYEGPMKFNSFDFSYVAGPESSVHNLSLRIKEEPR